MPHKEVSLLTILCQECFAAVPRPIPLIESIRALKHPKSSHRHFMSISVPNSYSNSVTEDGDMIEGDDAFHEDDDNISLEGLDDDDDDISTVTPDASMCIVCCHPYLDQGCNLNHVVPQICHRRPPYSKGGRSYPTCGLTCASILAGGATNVPSHRTGQYGGASRAGSNRSYVQNALQSRVSPAIGDVAQLLIVWPGS